jgi:hypothetical protein
MELRRPSTGPLGLTRRLGLTPFRPVLRLGIRFFGFVGLNAGGPWQIRRQLEAQVHRTLDPTAAQKDLVTFPEVIV